MTMRVHVEEVGSRLRALAREWRVPEWSRKKPRDLRDGIRAAYQRELDREMRERAVAAALRRADVPRG